MSFRQSTFRPAGAEAPMQGARFRLDGMRGKAALGLLALALMFRVLIPVGWMPTTGSGFAITLCTGMGAVTAWVDKDGHTHKERSEEHTSELQSLMRISYAVFCLKQKTKKQQ